MSWTSPLTVPMTNTPLPPASAFSMCGSRNATAAFIVSALCSTNGSCISPLPNRSPTTFMPSSRTSLMIDERLAAARPAPRRARRSRPSRSPSMMRCLSRSSTGQPERSSLLDGADLDAVEVGHQLGERVVAVAAAVVDEVERELARLLVDLVHRHDARRVHDRGVEPGLAALVQEHAVQHVADRRVQPEAHVREPEDRRRAGQLGLDPPDRLDRLHARPCAGPPGRSRAGT